MGCWNRIAGFCLALLVCGAAHGADSLKWDGASNTVAAEVQSWTVPDVLQQVAGATGWQIFLDPEITNRVPAKFSGKQPGDALRSLLGGYNYALVPDTKGPSRLFVFRTSREQATRAIAPPAKLAKKKSSRIANELIVTLKPGEKIEDLAKRLGAKVVGRSDAQNTYRLRFDDEQATETARSSLQDDSAVEDIDGNFTVPRPDVVQPLDMPGGPLNLTPKVTPDGKYVVVGLVDSPLQPKEGNLSQFLHPSTAPGDLKEGGDLSHGTSMAAAILRAVSAGSADNTTIVRILPINVFTGDAEQTTTFDIAKGIFDVVSKGANPVNLSLGGDGDSSFLHKTIKSAHEQGVTFFGAAGNDGGSAPTFPAAYSEVTAVTALDKNGKLAPYATFGDWVDVAAPGYVNVSFNGQLYSVLGTSTATALVSGKAAAEAAAKRIAK